MDYDTATSAIPMRDRKFATEADEPRGPVVRQCVNELEKVLETTSDSFRMLEERLGAILTPEESENPVGSAKAPYSVPLARDIDSCTERSRWLNERILRLLQRVEV